MVAGNQCVVEDMAGAARPTAGMLAPGLIFLACCCVEAQGAATSARSDPVDIMSQLEKDGR